MRNGVSQGAVLNAILYCIYMNELFGILRRSKFGCWVNGDFFGILWLQFSACPQYPCTSVEMLHICEQYAADHDLKFSTDPNPSKCKTKCIGYFKEEKVIATIKTLWK